MAMTMGINIFGFRLGSGTKAEDTAADDDRPVAWLPTAFDSNGDAFAWDIVYADR